MKNRSRAILALALVAALPVLSAVLLPPAAAQQSAPGTPVSGLAGQEREARALDFVTINVKDANIAEVLKAYSLQTGQSIVVGPDVVSDNVNVRLNNIPWEDALDVILKPYGFGYRVVGDTIVISRLENIVTVEGIEPLVSRVFNLKYLDAYDIREVCEAQLSSRGKISIPANKGLPRWEFGAGARPASGASASQSGLGSVKREKEQAVEKSKMLIVTDVPSIVSRIERVIDEMDRMPAQVLIEARFIEINTGALKDIGIDFATGKGGLASAGVEASNPDGNNQWGVEKNNSAGNLTPEAFVPRGVNLNAFNPYDAGLQLLFSRVGGENFEIMLHALQEDGDAKVLSAPRVLTQNNQEAAILVGEKFPIIESQQSSSGGTDPIVTTTLKYYEDIGIRLNVIPQVCADNHINMIVHPVVSEISGFETGVVSTGNATKYPRLNVREAQSQIMVRSGDTVAIGGLQNDRSIKSVYKVPLLGDIPLLGRLFRRETTKTTQVELVILIKSTIVANQGYAAESRNVQSRMEEWSRFKAPAAPARAAQAAPPAVSSAEPAPAAATPAATVVEEEEILALVKVVEAGR